MKSGSPFLRNFDNDKKDNNYANLFNYNLESEFYGNRYLAKYPGGYNQTEEV